MENVVVFDDEFLLSSHRWTVKRRIKWDVFTLELSGVVLVTLRLLQEFVCQARTAFDTMKSSVRRVQLPLLLLMLMLMLPLGSRAIVKKGPRPVVTAVSTPLLIQPPPSGCTAYIEHYLRWHISISDAEVLGQGRGQTARETLEAWHTTTTSINRCVTLPAALRVKFNKQSYRRSVRSEAAVVKPRPSGSTDENRPASETDDTRGQPAANANPGDRLLGPNTNRRERSVRTHNSDRTSLPDADTGLTTTVHTVTGRYGRGSEERSHDSDMNPQPDVNSGVTTTANTVTGSSKHGRTSYARDIWSGRCFLVDTSAQQGVIPPTPADRHCPNPGLFLRVVNTSPITTVGTCSFSLGIGLWRLSPWIFVVADIPCGILGADFLAAFDLLIDCGQSRLHNKTTNRTVRGIYSSDASRYLTVLNTEPENPFQQVLAYYPGLSRPNFSASIPPHDVLYHIRTAGPPAFSRPRRLAPARLVAAKTEFERTLQVGITRQSESPCASPLHIVPKAATGD
ncbi:hypothetical protein SprV_0301315500 [Sparganum proliferum]